MNCQIAYFNKKKYISIIKSNSESAMDAFPSFSFMVLSNSGERSLPPSSLLVSSLLVSSLLVSSFLVSSLTLLSPKW